MLKAPIERSIDNKIAIATEGLTQQYTNRSLHHDHKDNALSIGNFIIACQVEGNNASTYKENLIFTLCKLSDHVGKPFAEFTREDNISYLDSGRKTEADDPTHKWVGIYNVRRVFIVKFFRWFYFQDIEQTKRPKPNCVQNIPRLKRKEKSKYAPSDLWTVEDDILFLRFCPSVRDKCYHMVSRDSSCRPHEILKLKINDVVFKTVNANVYAKVLLNGKTGSRNIPLINSIPYVKDWLDQHPQRTNPNAAFICGIAKSLGRRIGTPHIYRIYRSYKEEIFPRLLNNPDICVQIRNTFKPF